MNLESSMSILHFLSKDAMGKAFFPSDWSLVQSRSHWFVQCVKNEPMARQRCCTSLWRRNPLEPARMGGAIWLYKRPFRHRNSDGFSFSDDDDFVSHWSRRPARRWNSSQLEPVTSAWLNPPPSQHCSSSGPASLQQSGEAHTFF